MLMKPGEAATILIPTLQMCLRPDSISGLSGSRPGAPSFLLPGCVDILVATSIIIVSCSFYAPAAVLIYRPLHHFPCKTTTTKLYSQIALVSVMVLSVERLGSVLG